MIALVVLGPDRLPQAARALGQAIRSVKKYIHETTKELEDIEDLKNIQQDVQDIGKDLRSMGSSLEKSIRDEVDAAEAELKTAGEDIQAAVEAKPEDAPVITEEPAVKEDEITA